MQTPSQTQPMPSRLMTIFASTASTFTLAATAPGVFYAVMAAAALAFGVAVFSAFAPLGRGVVS
jgi:hypothetical protein